MAAALSDTAKRWPAAGAWAYGILLSLWVAGRWIASGGKINDPGWLMLVPLQTLAIVAVLRMVHLRKLGFARRLGWRLLAAAFVVDMLAIIDWDYLFIVNPQPLGTSADLLYFVNYVLLAGASGAFFVSCGGSLTNPRVWLDGATLALGAMAGLIPVFVGPLEDGSSVPAGSVPAAASYGIGIVTVTTITLLLFMQIVDWRRERAILGVIVGIGIGLLTDVGAIAANLRGYFRLANLDDLGSCWSYVIVILATLSERDTPAAAPAPRTGDNVYSFVAVFAILTSLSVLLGAEASPSGIGRSAATIIVLGGASLLLLRQLAVRRELARLNAALAARDAAEQVAVRAAVSMAARHAAERRLAAISNLTASVAHEFNNQLMITLQASGLLAGSTAVAGDEESAELIAAIERATRRSTAMTTQLLFIARQQQLHPEAVNLRDFLADSLPSLRDSAGASVQVIISAEDAMPAVQVDPRGLLIALRCLIANARDAMTGRGILTIVASWVNADRRIRIDVDDQGCGMSPEVLSRAVDPFFTTKAVGSGSGLGLSVVDGFLRQSGGELVLRSAPGQGTNVTMFLPAEPRAVSQPVPSIQLGE
jgi:signal transduction histidine kinase